MKKLAKILLCTIFCLAAMLPGGCADSASPSSGACVHEYEVIESQNPTCTAIGAEVYACKKCGDTYTETLSALGHDWGAWMVRETPSCAHDGCQTRSCMREGCNKSETAYERVPHSYRQTSSEPSTCSHRGKKTYECEECHATYTEYCEALTHTPSNAADTAVTASCTADGYAENVCSVCGQTYRTSFTPRYGHSFVDHLCTRCGEPSRETFMAAYPVTWLDSSLSFDYSAANAKWTFKGKDPDGEVHNFITLRADAVKKYVADGATKLRITMTNPNGVTFAPTSPQIAAVNGKCTWETDIRSAWETEGYTIRFYYRTWGGSADGFDFTVEVVQ